jgi:hypothetical protein
MPCDYTCVILIVDLGPYNIRLEIGRRRVLGIGDEISLDHDP